MATKSCVIAVLAADEDTARAIVEQFMSWLDGAGEQFFWDHCNIREEAGEHTNIKYDYDGCVITMVHEPREEGE